MDPSLAILIRMTSKIQPSGLVVVDKPTGWTSHDVVGKLRKIFGTRKVGHSGTLDPMATGVLVCGVGNGTRLLRYLSEDSKSYDATIRLGVSSDTDDSDGELRDLVHADFALDDVQTRLNESVGSIEQRPSTYSAIKVDGERAYDRARRGEEFELPARRVQIFEISAHEARRIDAESLEGSKVINTEVDVTVRCSSGTYIRAIARDLGASLEVGGILTALRRTQVGRSFDSPATLDELEASPDLIALDDCLGQLFSVITIDESTAATFCNGGRLSLDKLELWISPDELPKCLSMLESDSPIGVKSSAGRALGVARLKNGAIAPEVVWPARVE